MVKRVTTFLRLIFRSILWPITIDGKSYADAGVGLLGLQALFACVFHIYQGNHGYAVSCLALYVFFGAFFGHTPIQNTANNIVLRIKSSLSRLNRQIEFECEIQKKNRR